MRVFRSIETFTVRPKPLVLALGNFDGIHLGHQELIKRTAAAAAKLGLSSAVLTFSEHPQQILHPSKRPALLTTTDQRLMLFKLLKIDECFMLPFTKEFSEIKAGDFVEHILVKQLNVKKVFLGYNAHFGKSREGNAELMRAFGGKLGFDFEEVAPVTCAGDSVSSSRIRSLIQSGGFHEAEECLGRPYSILGEVVPGMARGRELGYPTANLRTDAEVLPPEGVYPVRLRLIELEGTQVSSDEQRFGIASLGRWFDGVMNFGSRPTFDSSGEKVLEVFILDFDQKIYGKRAEVAFYPQLRAEQKFSGPAALKKQIENDVAQARKYLNARPVPARL